MSITNLKSSDFVTKKNGVYVTHPSAIGTPGMLLIWADFCGHCHTFIPKYKQIAKFLGEEFKCMAIENGQFKNNPELSDALEVQYFPTIKFFDQNGKIIGTYPSNQPREIDQVLKYVCEVYHHCTLYH